MISIVIPTLNEEKNIEKTLYKIEKVSKKFTLDVIIVDDNSKDNTIKIVEQFFSKLNIKIIRNRKKLGLGYALNLGYKSSYYSFVMFLDADLSVSENDITKLFHAREKNGIVIGSRYIKGSKIIGADKKKVLASYLLNLLISKIFRLKIIDISHSFRIISKKVGLITKNFTHPGFFGKQQFAQYGFV